MTTKAKKQAELRQRWETIDDAFRKTEYELNRQGVGINSEGFMLLDSALRRLLETSDGYRVLKFVIERVAMLENAENNAAA
jgi:hypothetical protein